MSTHLLVVDLRDDFDRVTQGLRHYEGRSPDASFVVLIPEQSAVIEESERNRGFAAGAEVGIPRGNAVERHCRRAAYRVGA